MTTNKPLWLTSLGLVLVMLFLSLLLVQPTQAEKASFSLPQEVSHYLPTGKNSMLDFCSNSTLWMPLGMSDITTVFPSEGTKAILISAGQDNKLGAYRTFLDYPVQSTDCLIPYRFYGTGEATAFLTIGTNIQTHNFILSIPAPGEGLFVIDMRGLQGEGLVSFKIELLPSQGNTLDALQLSGFYLCSHAIFELYDETNDALVFATTGSTLSLEEDVYTLFADSKPGFSVLFPGVRSMNGYVSCQLTLSETASLEVFLLNADGSECSLGNQLLLEGTHQYLFPCFEGRMAGLRFQFDALLAEIQLKGLSFVSSPASSSDSDVKLGQITSAKINTDTKELTVVGKLSSQTVIDYMGWKIELMELSATESALPIALETQPISTRFSFVLPLDTLNFKQSLFQAFLSNGKDRIAVGIPMLPETSDAAQFAEKTAVGFIGPSPTNVFLSQTKEVVLDISVDRLAGIEATVQNEKILSYRGTTFSLDADYLKELDHEMTFYKNADISVLIRLVLEKPLPDSPMLFYDYDAPAYAPDNLGNDGLLFEAITDFLVRRYSNTSGLILGYALDDPLRSASAFGSIEEYASDLSKTIRTLSQTALRVNSHLKLFLPFSLNEGIGLSNAPLLLTLLSDELSKNGGTSYVLLFVKSEALETTAIASFLSRLPTTFTSPTAFALTLEKQPTDTIIPTAVQLSASQSPKFSHLFFNVAETTGQDFFEAFRVSAASSTRILQTVPAAQDTRTHTSSISLWDFSRSFDALGWISDGSFSDPVTTSSPALAGFLGFSSCRVLVASLEEKRNEGVLLCRSEDLLLQPGFSGITISLLGTGDPEMKLSILLGTESGSLEYPVTLKSQEATTLFCSLSPILQSTHLEYVAFVCGQEVATISVADISLVSDSFSQDYMNDLFHVTETEEKDSHLLQIVAIVISFFVISLVFIAVINSSRTKKKEAEKSANV